MIDFRHSSTYTDSLKLRCDIFLLSTLQSPKSFYAKNKITHPRWFHHHMENDGVEDFKCPTALALPIVTHKILLRRKLILNDIITSIVSECPPDVFFILELEDMLNIWTYRFKS